ncbi:hypothetical protein BDV11DRAFT_197006 [Aspergillus similis]
MVTASQGSTRSSGLASSCRAENPEPGPTDRILRNEKPSVGRMSWSYQMKSRFPG